MRASFRYGLHAAFALSASALTALPACTAESEAAEGTGSITGTIVFEGRAPKMPAIQMAANPECEAVHDEPVLSERLVLDDEQHMANVMVHVIGGLPGGVRYPVPKEPVVMSQKGCMYSPHVFGIRAGQPLKFSNPDAFLHNVHALPNVNTEFNRSMNSQRTEITTTFDKPEPAFKIKCDIHAWMLAYCWVFDHPYFAVSAADGTYTIDGLPPGEYEIEAWHEIEALGTHRATVKVEASGTATADFAFTPPSR